MQCEFSGLPPLQKWEPMAEPEPRLSIGQDEGIQSMVKIKTTCKPVVNNPPKTFYHDFPMRKVIYLAPHPYKTPGLTALTVRCGRSGVVKEVELWEEVKKDIGKTAMLLLAPRSLMNVDVRCYSEKNHYAAIFKRHENEGAPLALIGPGKTEVKEFWNHPVYDLCSCLDESDFGLSFNVMFANLLPQDFYRNQSESDWGECELRCEDKPCQITVYARISKYLISKFLEWSYKKDEFPDKHMPNLIEKGDAESGLSLGQDDAYPTEQMMQQKAAREEREQELADQGLSKEEIMQIRKSKKKSFKQDEHFDDCGSDVSPLMDSEYLCHLCCSETLDDAVEASFFDSIWATEDPLEYDEEKVCHGFCQMEHYAWKGSGECLPSEEVDGELMPVEPVWLTTPAAVTLKPAELSAYLSRPEMKGDLGIMELFGGMAGVTKVCIRRRLTTGINVDLECGFDMVKKDQREMVMEYFDTHKPFMITMGPPGTSFGSWSHISRKKYRRTWEDSRRIGEALADCAAAAATKQLSCGRHFLIENPCGSEIFKLPSFEKLWNTRHVCKMHIPQCALGLTVLGQPVRKMTTLWASSWILLKQFE